MRFNGLVLVLAAWRAVSSVRATMKRCSNDLFGMLGLERTQGEEAEMSVLFLRFGGNPI